MTNVYGTEGKILLRRKLFEAGIGSLEKEGWAVERERGSGKASVRRIRRGDESKLVSIRTTQDTWIAFPRDKTDSEWVTLSMVDVVVAVSVDDRLEPKFAQVHFLDGDEMRDRFDRAYRMRIAAGHSIPLGRGLWLSLYEKEAEEPLNLVGAGAGLDTPPFARVSLDDLAESSDENLKQMQRSSRPEEFLSIEEAKRRLALTLGVGPENVKIIIEA